MTAFLIVAVTVAAFTAVCVWADTVTDDEAGDWQTGDTNEWWV